MVDFKYDEDLAIVYAVKPMRGKYRVYVLGYDFTINYAEVFIVYDTTGTFGSYLSSGRASIEELANIEDNPSVIQRDYFRNIAAGTIKEADDELLQNPEYLNILAEFEKNTRGKDLTDQIIFSMRLTLKKSGKPETIVDEFNNFIQSRAGFKEICNRYYEIMS